MPGHDGGATDLGPNPTCACASTGGCVTRFDTPAHCGACDVSCGGATPYCARDGAGYHCSQQCDGASTLCGSQCVDTQSDPQHCGGCAPCGAGKPYCIGATCAACPAGQRQCGDGTCRAEDIYACGPSCTACPAPADATATCDQGVCGFTCPPGTVRAGDGCMAAGFRVERPLANIQALYGAWGSSAHDVYMVGSGGLILHSPGDGTWTRQASGTNQYLRAIWGSGPNDIYAGGNGRKASDINVSGAILHSTGNGVWSEINSSGRAPSVQSIWGSGPNDVYLTGQFFYHGTGNGVWTTVSGIAHYGGAVWGTDATNVYEVNDTDINHLVSGAWRAESTGAMLPQLSCIWGSSASDIWVGGVKSFFQFDGPNNWFEVPDPLGGGTPAGLWGSGPNDIYAVGRTNGFAHSGIWHYTGGLWNEVIHIPAKDYLAVWGSGPDDVYFGAEDGVILHYCTRGDCNSCPAGQHQCGDGTCRLESAAACGASCAVCPAPAGATATCTEGACDFICPSGSVRLGDGCDRVTLRMENTPNTSDDIYSAIWGSSAGDVYVVGDRGLILHSAGDGVWARQTSGTSGELRALWGSGPGDVYAVGSIPNAGTTRPVILHSTGNGAWAELGNINVDNNLTAVSIWGSSAGDVYVSSQEGFIYHGTGAGTWTRVSGISDAGLLWGTSATNLYAVGPFSDELGHFVNGAWGGEEGLLPLSFTRAIWGSSAGDVWLGAERLISHSTGVDDWAALRFDGDIRALWGSGPADVYAAATSPAGDAVIWHYGGRTWAPMTDFPSTRAMRAIWGSGPDDVYFVGYGDTPIIHKVH